MNHATPSWIAIAVAVAAWGGVVAPAVSAATLQVYTDEASWAAGLDFQTEEFLDADWSDSGLSMDTTGGGDHWVYTDALDVHLAGVYSGVLEDRVSTSKSLYTIITFKQAVSAFAADWDLSLAGSGEGLSIWLDTGDGLQSVEVAMGAPGFFGFRSSGTFTMLSIRGAGLHGASAEGYSMDNARFGNSVTAVPEPATVLLWAAGIGGIAALRKRVGARHA